MSSKIIKNLVRQAQGGDADSFGALYELFSKDMFRFAYYYTGSVAFAEDCVSETALIAFQKITELKKSDSFKSWLFKILYNQCKAAQKEKIVALSRSEYVNETTVDTYTPMQHSEHIALKNALKALPEEEREILILHYSCGYTSKEIGNITGLKDATVRSKISRSTAKLRTMLSM